MSDVAADPSTTAVTRIGGTYWGVLEMSWDQDWIRIDLTAGEAVRIDMRGRGYDPVDDPLLRLYAADGTFLASDDDDGGTGSDAQLTYRPAVTGTYYIAAQGLGGFSGGDYRIDVTPYTGTGTPPVSTNFAPAPRAPTAPLATIMGDTILSDHVVEVYFGRTGESFDGISGEGFSAYEQAQFQRAFDRIEAVADVEFRIVTDPARADFRLVMDIGEMEANTLGYFYSPGGYSLAGVGVFNGAAFGRQSGGNLEPGGIGTATITHELLHGLGLMHPHDGGGGSAVMAGVSSAFDSFGLADLNQGIYTAMSYNTGFADMPSWTPSFGSEIGPMALDIAALQRMYGAVRNNWGNSFYVLDSANGPGTGWQAIWDTGGTDVIVHNGGADATINLRMANLTYGPGGGGYVSSVGGVLGGYTIAAGAMIENARGGWGNDRIIGNGADNVLAGRAGRDVLFGRGDDDILRGGRGRDFLAGNNGDDLLRGQKGNDRLRGDAGADQLVGGVGHDTFVFRRVSDSGNAASKRDVILDFQRGNDRIDLSKIDAHRGQPGDQAFDFLGRGGFDGNDWKGDLRVKPVDDRVVVSVDVDGDGCGDMKIEVHGVTMLFAADFIL